MMKKATSYLAQYLLVILVLTLFSCEETPDNNQAEPEEEETENLDDQETDNVPNRYSFWLDENSGEVMCLVHDAEEDTLRYGLYKEKKTEPEYRVMWCRNKGNESTIRFAGTRYTEDQYKLVLHGNTITCIHLKSRNSQIFKKVPEERVYGGDKGEPTPIADWAANYLQNGSCCLTFEVTDTVIHFNVGMEMEGAKGTIRIESYDPETYFGTGHLTSLAKYENDFSKEKPETNERPVEFDPNEPVRFAFCKSTEPGVFLFNIHSKQLHLDQDEVFVSKTMGELYPELLMAICRWEMGERYFPHHKIPTDEVINNMRPVK